MGMDLSRGRYWGDSFVKWINVTADLTCEGESREPPVYTRLANIRKLESQKA